MSFTIPMDKAGRIVIPRAVREALGADETTRFDLAVVLDRIELTPHREGRGKGRVVKKDGLWVVAASGKPFCAAEAVHADRAERIHFLEER
jgi:AbrB family looped-hinge helix DNA binding protein